MRSGALCHTVSHYVALCCSVTCVASVLQCVVLMCRCSPAKSQPILHCVVLCCTVSHCVALCRTVLHCDVCCECVAMCRCHVPLLTGHKLIILHCDALCCTVSLYVALCCSMTCVASVLQYVISTYHYSPAKSEQIVVLCCAVLHHVALCRSVLQYDYDVCCNVSLSYTTTHWQHAKSIFALCCTRLRSVALYCTMLHCDVCCNVSL